jgi:hypothetical protein
MIEQLVSDSVAFQPVSHADPNGRLFRWNGRLFRQVSDRRSGLYRRLIEEGTAGRLAGRGLLVETSIAPFELEGSLVLEHREIPFLSYPYEWPAPMLRDAALTTLDLAIELLQEGLCLQDAHPWNVLFDGPDPCYVDFGSIAPLEEADHVFAADEFDEFFRFPLLLMAAGQARIARSLLHDHERGVTPDEFAALWEHESLRACVGGASRRLASRVLASLPERSAAAARRVIEGMRERRRARPGTRDPLGELRSRREEIARVPVELAPTPWTDYYGSEFPPFDDTSAWNPKHVEIARTLERLEPETVLDIGSNEGWYSQLAARGGARVVSFDRDETCLAKLYEAAREQRLPILPLVMNLMNPSPGYGLSSDWPPALERFRCDVVLALALVHHLALRQQIGFERIVRALSAFARRALVVEFVPPEDRYVREWLTPVYHWYTLDRFRTALARRWERIAIVPSTGVRMLLVCEGPLPDRP